MTLSCNEIKTRAINFSREWTDTQSEGADAKPFLDTLLNMFGIIRKKVDNYDRLKTIMRLQ